ncbi:hypothetical protein [Agromyces bauzanensis]
MSTIQAGALRYANASIIQCEGWDEPRELGCVAVDGDQVVLGIWPESDDVAEFDEYRLPLDAEVEVIAP